MKYILTIIFVIATFSQAVAEDNYLCKIKSVSEVDKKGGISAGFDKSYSGDSFSVSKVTGVMKGSIQNTLGGTPEIVQPVSSEYSFKVFTKSVTNHIDGYYLQIQDFKYSESKPFMFIQSGFIYHGLCK